MGGSIMEVTTSDAARHRLCTPPFCTSRTGFIHVDGMKLWLHRGLDGKNGIMVVWAADRRYEERAMEIKYGGLTV